MTSLPSFAAFFRELWGYDPFPWQDMLANRVLTDGWPAVLDLPTATGKTACIDIAIYALAAQAGLPLGDRAAPRRVWFVVDRRIVVDEAHERAKEIAKQLDQAVTGSALGAVAKRLLHLSATDRALGVGRLRGGILRDDGCVHVPSQPAVITSTVDQLGSRLLFRAYGASQLTAPIYAGLAANDSLIILDEAHCSVPFLQTLRAIGEYRGGVWAERPIITPFGFVILSATPPTGTPDDAIFPGAERAAALEHPVLHERLHTSKKAELIGPLKSSSRQSQDPLVAEAVRRGLDYVKSEHRRVAIMVNRVRTAGDVAVELQAKAADKCDVVLLTGRMRPYERDRLVERWMPFLRAKAPESHPRPIAVISTQCLEVGADFNFDVLITEAASLDALRQRFGRLARMGADKPAPAAIIARDGNIDRKQSDPIYGDATASTWELLHEIADTDDTSQHTERIVDFGVEALDAKLAGTEDIAGCLAPVADAPIMLPAHIDVLAQTAPAAHPAPDIQLLLHGKGHHSQDAQVMWRADLSPTSKDSWIDTVSLCRPASGEMLSVPLHRLRSWLRQSDILDEGSDIEGAADASNNETAGSIRPCVLWRGQQKSEIATRAENIGPGDVVVVPADYRATALIQQRVGDQAVAEGVGSERLDLWEAAQADSGRPAAVRLNRAVLKPWLGCPAMKELVSAVEDEVDRSTVAEAIDAVLAYKPESGDEPSAPPDWWLELLKAVHDGCWRLDRHPAEGIVLFAKAEKKRHRQSPELDLFADADDLTSIDDQEVALDDHSSMVRRAVERTAALCLPEELVPPLCEAAVWHDAGKLDERFQALLHHGDELAALSADPLAQSDFIPSTPAQRRAIRKAVGLPDHFRHEMLSMRLLQDHLPPATTEADAQLILHLVASHHGHARPFAPICDDPEPPDVSGCLIDRQVELTGEARRATTPAHHLASGVAERFWTLMRRHGWWGLAYLEAILRLSDWYASGYVMLSKDGP